MCGTRGGWVVATSVGVMEAMKDQGYCRNWNNLIIRSEAQASSVISKKLMTNNEKMNNSEESLRTIMYLSCWLGS
ncbi:hypothetical protein QN277_008442 [Acacia crassicarpa]|uniref:Uncharacterized protein n=1 Tax=Acacia crassicarpa TaxID=499986 RepID=A0AAE1JLS0_9FABA|nr:hypothetical protein QN277_008442 [Acacia crassicarpa]